MPIIFLFNFLWPGSGPPGARGPRFIEPPVLPVATPLSPFSVTWAYLEGAPASQSPKKFLLSLSTGSLL